MRGATRTSQPTQRVGSGVPRVPTGPGSAVRRRAGERDDGERDGEEVAVELDCVVDDGGVADDDGLDEARDDDGVRWTPPFFG